MYPFLNDCRCASRLVMPGEGTGNPFEEISYAEKHNNQNRINGLNKALSEVRANCSDSDLRAKHQQKISEQQAEISERRAELHEAQQSGDREKISNASIN